MHKSDLEHIIRAASTMHKSFPLRPNMSGGAFLIANHMNVPYGRIVSAGDVAASLKNGYLAGHSKEVNGILAPFFNEVEPSLILRSAAEVGASIEKVNALYKQTLSLGFMPSPAWEKAISEFQRQN